MSQENIEIVRRAFAAWSEEGTAGVSPFFADEIEWHDPPEFPDADVHRGRDAVAARHGEFGAAGVFDLKIDIDEVSADGDRLVVSTKGRGRGVRSGTPDTGLPVFWVFVVKGG